VVTKNEKLSEQVKNVTTYDKLGKYITNILCNEPRPENAKFAKLVRNIYKYGVDKNKVHLSKYTPEQKQKIVAILELLFGTEVFRNPGALIEVNMMLDLIIYRKHSWHETIKALSFTPTEAVNCGRIINQTCNGFMKRKHQYQGEVVNERKENGSSQKENKVNVSQYIIRRGTLAEKWYKEFGEEDFGPFSQKNLRDLISCQNEDWYGWPDNNEDSMHSDDEESEYSSYGLS